jgi:trimethylamine---corrinoid protein Co-methyltransferase
MYQILDTQSIAAIHNAALRILSETGVILTHDEGRAILTGAGATIDGDRVLIPPDLVERCLQQSPNTVTLAGRDGNTVTLGDGSLHWHNSGGVPNVLDPVSKQSRPATIEDVQQSTRLLDAMSQVSSITPLYSPRDVPDPLVALAMYRHTLPHTVKLVHGPGIATSKEAKYAIRLAEVIGDPTNVLGLSVSPVSPLTYPDGIVDAILATAKAGIPFSLLPSPTVGTTAPASLSGALAQQNAEILAGIVLCQLVYPGLPIVYSGRLAVMEPRTGASIWGAVELGMISAATVQLGHHYNLPVNVYGFATNSYDYDVQSGSERAMNALLPALAGADELSGFGQLGAGVLSALAQIVIDNDLAASIQQARRGIRVDDNALAVDVIHSVMTGNRNFLAQKHTSKTLRSGELTLSKLAERGTWAEWDRQERAGLVGRAHAEAQRLINEHTVPPLSSQQESALDDILGAAERELV